MKPKIRLLRILSILVLMFLVLISSCSPTTQSTSNNTSSSTTSTSIITSLKPLQIEVTTDKSSYLPGEDITITFSIRNVTNSPFVIAPYVPEVDIRHFQTSGWGNEQVRTFVAGSDTRSLDPGQTETFTVTWDQRDNQGQQVPYGIYSITDFFPPTLF